MVETARDQGFVIKLLAVCERVTSSPTGAGLSARVYPALIDRNHALASVRGAFNAVFIEAEAAGELMIYGQGAGGAPTGSAVLGAIVCAARVSPARIDRNHALASVRGAFNAVFIEAEAAGELMLYGQGAGGAPTASAVLGDIVSVARRKVLGGRGQYERPFHEDSRILPI